MEKVHLIRCWSLALSTVLIILMAPNLALAAGDANEARCAAKTEASPGYREYLPDCRAYELATPPYKEGGVVLDEPGAISASGSSVIVGAGGAFSGGGNYWYDPGRNRNAATYELVRGRDGWGSSPLMPPAGEYSYSVLMAASAGNFEATLWGAEQTGLPYHEDIYLRTGPNPSEFNLIGPGTPYNEKDEEILANERLTPTEELTLVGASRNLSHSLFAIKSSNLGGHSDLWVGDTTELGKASLYEYVYVGTKNSEPVLVGVKNDEALHGGAQINEKAELISECGTELGSGGGGSVFNAVSSSGEVVFFTAKACSGSTPPLVNELYARIGGERTVAISEPTLPGGAAGECTNPEPCHSAKAAPAMFQGASEDGRRVFFMSEQPLVDGASAEGMKLYEVSLEGARVAQVIDISNKGIAAGVNPEVQGVVRVSENGERVYFVATAKLTSRDNVAGREPEEAEPVQGADNLYVYEPEPGHSGEYRTVFVATLLTPGEQAALATEEIEERAEITARGEKTFTYEVEPTKHEVERAEAEIIQKFFNEEIELERALELLAEAAEPLVEAEEAARERERAFIERTVGTLGPSGTVAEDRRAWQIEDGRPTQTTFDGAILVFLSSAKLTRGDTSGVPQVFAYDAQGESLARISIGQTGSESGNVDTFDQAPQIPIQPFVGVDLPTAADTGLTLSADASRIFFTSAADLAPQAEHDAVNVYEYSGGGVYLISSGGDTSRVNGAPTVSVLGTDASGQDAFFVSEDKLVPQYGDTQMALYDAREEGGFPTPALEPGCLGETCRGLSSATLSYQSPASAGQQGNGNVSRPPRVSEASGPQVTRAQLLAKALRSCRAMRPRKRRAACETRARRRFGGGSSVSRARATKRKARR